jgi:acetate kinase
MSDVLAVGPASTLILVLNCGSSSIKFALFDSTRLPLPRQPLWSGRIEGIGGPAPRLATSAGDACGLSLDPRQPYHAALVCLRERLRTELPASAPGGVPGAGLRAVAHRVVHGGERYQAPTWVDAGVLADLRRFIPLAPLHQPFALEALEVMLQDHPELPQLACFDTAFHHTLAPVERMLGLDWQAWCEGLRRYGFHGLSYDYLSLALAERHGELAQGRVIVAHLGSGASLCAMREGRSVATSMGFSALDGLMMGTRCGSLDAGALIHLMQTRGLDLDQTADLLYHRSGLLGLSGLSDDPRRLIAAEAAQDSDPVTAERAAAALALYVRRVVREVGALTAVLGGLDLLAFSAGIGERSAELRRRVCADLVFLGIRLDEAANAGHAAVISAPDSAVRVVVEATNEEWIAAQQVLTTL